jgi:hypothetical protein
VPTARKRLDHARIDKFQVEGRKGLNRFIEEKIRKQVLPKRVVQLYPAISLRYDVWRTYPPARSCVSESKGCGLTSRHRCIRDQTADTGRKVVPRCKKVCVSLDISNCDRIDVHLLTALETCGGGLDPLASWLFHQ